jgi:hypothetical protein
LRGDSAGVTFDAAGSLIDRITMDELSAVEQEELEEENRERAVKEALAKFNFFLHVTAWLSGCSFILIMGILLPKALPYVFIPIGLWTAGLAYHGFKAFRPKRSRPPAELE